MSRWTDLLESVERAEPSPLVPARALERAAELVERPARRGARRMIAIVAAGVACCLILGALALAAHTRSSTPEPAQPPFPTPPACAIAAGGSGVNCGPASAAIRIAEGWQVINQGSCINHTRLYFGAHTANDDAPLSLMLDMPSGALAKGGDVRVTNGQLALGSGAKESLSGQAVVEPGGKSGAFTVHGRDAQGKPDGNAYSGAWTCRAGHASQQAASRQTHQARMCTREEHQGGSFTLTADGYRIDCGSGSAILWVGGRWQVVFPANCGVGDLHFGVRTDPLPDRLIVHTESIIGAAPESQRAQDVIDGDMNLPGTHAALGGRAIFRRGEDGGAFDLNNRGGVSANRGGAGVGSPRVDYVGAWMCG
jgi:hypothetical protein